MVTRTRDSVFKQSKLAREIQNPYQTGFGDIILQGRMRAQAGYLNFRPDGQIVKWE
jgi:hypothetical protein